MSRTIIDKCPESPHITDNQHFPGMTTRTYDIEVITPIFGGGSEAGVVDPVTPIRGSTIRGHLRFWWRATRGAHFSDPKELRQREGEIWGTTDNPSPVEIEVDNVKHSSPVPCAEYKWDPKKKKYILIWDNKFIKTSIPYALFPFQGRPPKEKKPNCKNEKDPNLYLDNVSFNLIVRINDKDKMAKLRTKYNKLRGGINLSLLTERDDDLTDEIKAAMFAWVNFGGYGARTRRGCGALFCKEFAPKSKDDLSDLCIKNKTTKEWPTLISHLLVREPGDYLPVDIWNNLVGMMREFRQGEDVGRDKGTGPKSGRSRWPEPESVREIISKQRNGGERLSTMRPKDIRIPTSFFPRAEFGMPIIIEIRDESASNNRRIPLKCTIQYSKDTDRLASPIILRPIKFSNNEVGAMIAVLNTKPLVSAYLKKGKHDLKEDINLEGGDIRDACLLNYPNSPYHTAGSTASDNPDGSAVKAFLAFAMNNDGFERIYP